MDWSPGGKIAALSSLFADIQSIELYQFKPFFRKFVNLDAPALGGRDSVQVAARLSLRSPVREDARPTRLVCVQVSLL